MPTHGTAAHMRDAAQNTTKLDVGDLEISGPWLVVARATWIVLFVTNLWDSAVVISAYHRQAQRPCSAADCIVTAAQSASLQSLGITLRGYADLSTGVAIGLTLIGAIMAVALFIRRSNTWIALAVGVLLFTFSIGNLAAGTSVTVISPLIDAGLSAVSLAVAFSVFMIFPDGRFVPRWTWLLVVVWVVFHWALSIFSTTAWLYAFYPVIYLSALSVQGYRYLCISNAQRKQQTKLVVLAFIITLLGNILYWIALPAVIPALRAPGSLYPLFGYHVYLMLTLLLPLSFAIAIQRYRLFDVDVLIHRALVYGSLTFTLAALYFGLILSVQMLLRLLIGAGTPQPPMVIVFSTLLIAALFQPLRRRIQSLIDRQFYRRKYDAARILAGFSATVRAEADLSNVTNQLLTAVEETMQPTHVSLWLLRAKATTHSDTVA